MILEPATFVLSVASRADSSTLDEHYSPAVRSLLELFEGQFISRCPTLFPLVERIVLDTLGDFFAVFSSLAACDQAGTEYTAQGSDLLKFGIAQKAIRSGDGSGRRVADIVGDPQIPVTHDV